VALFATVFKCWVHGSFQNSTRLYIANCRGPRNKYVMGLKRVRKGEERCLENRMISLLWVFNRNLVVGVVETVFVMRFTEERADELKRGF